LAHAAAAVNSLIDDVMGQIQPVLNGTLTPQGMEQLQLGAMVDIDVSPIFDIGVSNDMSYSFHDNNDAYSVDGEVTRVNGGMAVSDFQNSLHDNNNAIGKGDVERLNGAGVETSDESTSKSLNSALNAMASMSSSVSPSNSSLLQTVRKPPSPRMSLIQKMNKLKDSDKSTLPSIVNDSVRHDIRRDSADAMVKIQVNPSFKIWATNNMTGAFYNNNNAKSEKGRVQRVNGAMAVANFSGALHDNNKALSTDGTVQRINGGDISTQVDVR